MVKLQKGQVFNNYKQLAIYLNEGVKTGEGKQVQVDKWSRQFTWSKQGNKWLIEEVHINPNSEIEFASASLSSKILLCEYFKNKIQNGIQIETQNGIDFQIMGGFRNGVNSPVRLAIFKSLLLEAIGLVNKDFFQGKKEADDKEFFHETETRSIKFLNDLFRAMANQKAIVLEESYLTKMGDLEYICTMSQTVQINEVYQQTLQEVGYKHLGIVKLTGNGKYFYNILNKKLKDKFGITYHKKLYIIGTTIETLDIYLNRIMPSFTDFNKIKHTCNRHSVKRLYRHFESKYKYYLSGAEGRLIQLENGEVGIETGSVTVSKGRLERSKDNIEFYVRMV